MASEPLKTMPVPIGCGIIYYRQSDVDRRTIELIAMFKHQLGPLLEKTHVQ